VPPAELFAVELFDVEPAGAPALPVRVGPLPDEALASWLLRFADPFGVSPETLLIGDAEADLARSPDWWRKPDPLLVAAIARGAGLSAPQIRVMTFAEWGDDLHDDVMPERFGRQRYVAERPSQQTRRIGICPECLAEDDTPYVRRAWTVGWAAICETHGSILIRACPDCGAKPRLPASSSDEHFAPDRCSRCAYRLPRAPTRPAPELVRRLQRRLIEGRAKPAIDLPDVGALAWPSVAALCDVLLGALWIDTKPQARSQLFTRIARDLECEPLGDASDGLAALVILAWLLDAWPSHAQAALAILRASRPRRQMQRWPNLDADVRAEIEALLLQAWPDERHGADRAAWRGWIDDLPETGEDLRAQAKRERLPHRRARLLAIADVRDGLPVEVVAEIADVLPRTLYRWLKRGAAGGLDAALERPSGRLSEPQVAELAEWIASASPDSPRWRANRVQSEALRRFGVEITIHVAGRLLRNHGRWRRRKVLGKRRLTVAPVYE